MLSFLNRKIHNKLPLNISNNELELFRPYKTYQIKPLKIKYLKNAFVTYNGYCIYNNQLIKECHHDYPDQLNVYKTEADKYYRDLKYNKNNIIELDNENVYLLIHHSWFNYYHWLCEVILRLWLVKKNTKKMILLMPENYSKVNYIKSSLEPFLFKNIFVIPHKKSVLVSNLCMPQMKPICDMYYPKQLNEIRNFYRKYILKTTLNKNLGDKIYLSRNNAFRRKVKNSIEVESLVQRYGFVVVSAEDYTFWEQVSIFSHARYFISIHGAGLTNMLFMQENSSIIELHKKRTNNNDWHSLAFWYLAEALNYNYYHQICNPANELEDFFKADLIVDTPLLEKNLKIILKE